MCKRTQAESETFAVLLPEGRVSAIGVSGQLGNGAAVDSPNKQRPVDLPERLIAPKGS